MLPVVLIVRPMGGRIDDQLSSLSFNKIDPLKFVEAYDYNMPELFNEAFSYVDAYD